MRFLRSATCRHGRGRVDLASRMPRDESRKPRWPAAAVARRLKMQTPGCPDWEVKYLQASTVGDLDDHEGGGGMRGGLHYVVAHEMESTWECAELYAGKVDIFACGK